jgi:hypothetical protein
LRVVHAAAAEAKTGSIHHARLYRRAMERHALILALQNVGTFDDLRDLSVESGIPMTHLVNLGFRLAGWNSDTAVLRELPPLLPV